MVLPYDWWYGLATFPVDLDYGPVRNFLADDVTVLAVPLLVGTPARFRQEVEEADRKARTSRAAASVHADKGAA